MASGAAFILKSGDSAVINNPPPGYVTIGVDDTLGPYSKGTGTLGGTDGVVTLFGMTVEALEDIIGGMLTDSSVIDVTYDDVGNLVTFTIVAGSVTPAMLSFDPATQVELDAEATARALVATNLATHIANASGAHAASAISNTPAGTVAATTVQAAINELDTEKVPTTRTLTAGSGLAGGGDLSADRTFDVNVDGSSIEIATDTLRVKALGITDAMLTGGISNTKLTTNPLARANHTGTQLASTISDFDTQVRTSRPNQLATANADLPLGANKITGLADGVALTDAATVGQLSAALSNKSYKDPVDAMTTGALPAGTYANGTAGVGATFTETTNGALPAQDGVTLAVGDDLLVKNQAAGLQNGIYKVTTLGSAGAPFVLTRRTDADTSAELSDATVLVDAGTTGQGDIFTFPSVTTIGTTDATPVKTGEGNTVYTADGSTLDLTGTTFSVKSLGITNAHINASAAIAYSKLNLALGIVNADINASAAIAYSKLALSNSIVNSDVAAGAAIVYSKLSLAASIVNADIASGAAIIYSKLALANSIVNADIGASAAIAYSKLALTGAILNADLAGSIALSKIANQAAATILGNNTGGSGPPLALTAAQTKTLLAIANTDVSGLGTASTKNIGNTVLDPGTGKLEFAIPSGGLVTGANKTYVATDRGYVYRRSNSGVAMSDTLPLLTNTTADIGYTVGVYNEDTVVAAVLTMNASGGALFRSGTGSTSATSPVNFGCRQQYIWDGTQWLLYAGNANLVRRSGTIVAGNIPSFVDTTGNSVVDSGVPSQQVQATLTGRAAGAGTGAIGALTPAQAKTLLAIANTDVSGLGTLSTQNGTFSGVSSGTNTGDVSLTAVGAVPNANGASLSGQALTLQPASSTQPGLLLSAMYNQIVRSGLSRVNILDYGGDNTGTSDNATAIANAMAALPAVGGVVYFPSGTYLLGSNISVTKTIVFEGDTAAQSIITLTHATADGFTFANWNSGFDTLMVQGLGTTLTALRAGGETTLPVQELANFPATGSVSYGGTAGWVTVTYTGKSAASGPGNLIGCTGVTAAANGAVVMIRTGGYIAQMPPVTASGGNYNFVNNCKFYNCFNGIFFASALGYLDTLEIRNVRSNAVVVDGNNDKFINRLTTASPTLMATSVLVNLTSSLLMQQCQILNGAVGLDLNAANGITIPSVEGVNCFFDNCTIGMRITATGTGSIYRSKFTNCWFSSGATAGVQFNTVNFDGISFASCEFYGNGKGIAADIVGGGHWQANGCFFAGNTTAIALSASAAHFPQILGCEIGPRAAFGVNAIGIQVVSGTYKGLIIQGGACVDNTSNINITTITVANATLYRIEGVAGLNPTGLPVVATPAIPASTVVVTNTTGRKVTIWLKNGTTAPTVVTVNGVAITGFYSATASVAATTIQLDPGGTIAMTYTVAPTWVWVGN